jgi:5-oxoprolinase (ATP-hydrolysing)
VRSAHARAQRRAIRPYGLAGGAPGACGQNLWLRRTDGASEGYRVVNLGGKATVKMSKGDRLRVLTPGGGGWGAKADGAATNGGAADRVEWEARGSFARQIDF